MKLPRALLVLPILIAPAHALAQSELTEAVRGLLEPNLREQAGIGFEEFSCHASPPLGPGDRFDCTALDEEGDRLRYTLAIDAEGTATVVLASQDAASLDPQALEKISAPCLAFLAAFEARDWDGLLGQLPPSLLDSLEPDEVRDRLETVRSALGDMSDPVATWYSLTDGGGHRLEFRVPATVEGGAARFGLVQGDDGSWSLRAFLVHADLGSPLGSILIGDLGSTVLSGLLGSPVRGIQAPYDQLSSVGDLIEGSVSLEDGRELPIAVQQTSGLQGFDAPNYFFSVLDAELVVTLGVRDRLEGVQKVECEAPQVPDGGEIGCLVHRDGEPPLRLILSRRGAEHRLRGPNANGG